MLQIVYLIENFDSLKGIAFEIGLSLEGISSFQLLVRENKELLITIK